MKARALAAVALLAACSHGEPYRVPTYGGDQPLGNAIPAVRLTYSTLNDSEASWLPDGSALLYSALRADFPDTTWCIEALPPGGGQAFRSWCPIAKAPPDSARAFQAAAASPTGRLLYLRSARTRPSTGWTVRQLVLADLGGTAAPQVILAWPFPQYTGLSQIRWLTRDRFVFRADMYYVQYPCSGCLPFEGDSGLFLVAGNLATSPPTFTRIPGIANPSSIAALDSNTILFTISGDTRLYRLAMASGVVDTVRDFAPSIPNAVQVSGRRLALTLDGLVALASLDTTAIQYLDTLPYNGLALSPDGKRLVAQRDGDLFEFVLP